MLRPDSPNWKRSGSARPAVLSRLFQCHEADDVQTKHLRVERITETGYWLLLSRSNQQYVLINKFNHMNYFIYCLKNYTTFTGRARRSEYWFFVLFNFIFSMSAGVTDFLLGFDDSEFGWGPVSLLYSLAVLLPSIAVGVRRLHDVGKSGWYHLILLIPIVGWIWFFVLLVTDGDSNENVYGLNPKTTAGMSV